VTTSTNEAREMVTISLTDKTVSLSLNAVAQMVFPFRSLETQKQWMQRCMQKPEELFSTGVATQDLGSGGLFPNASLLLRKSCFSFQEIALLIWSAHIWYSLG
jgi:hypothetical protein